MAQYGSCVLYFFAAEAEHVRETIMTQGGLPLLVKCMEAHPTVSAVQVRFFCCLPLLFISIFSQECLHTTFQVARYSLPSCAATKPLRKLACASCILPCFIPTAAYAPLQERVCWTLDMLGRHSAARRLCMVEAGVISLVHRALRDHASDRYLAEWGIKLINVLAAGSVTTTVPHLLLEILLDARPKSHYLTASLPYWLMASLPLCLTASPLPHRCLASSLPRYLTIAA